MVGVILFFTIVSILTGLAAMAEQDLNTESALGLTAFLTAIVAFFFAVLTMLAHSLG